MFFEKDPVRKRHLSPLQAELDQMEQRAQRLEESAGHFPLVFLVVVFFGRVIDQIENLLGFEVHFVVGLIGMLAFFALLSIPLKALAKRITLIVRARRPKLMEEVHAVIFSGGLFQEFAEELMSQERGELVEPEQSLLRPLKRLWQPQTKAGSLLSRLKGRAMQELRKGKHSDYFDFARRPLGMIEIETAVLLTIVEELKQPAESSVVQANASDTKVQLSSTIAE